MTGAQFSFCQVQRDAGLVQILFDLIFCICQLGQKNLRQSQRSDAAPVFRIYSAVRLPEIRFADMDTHSVSAAGEDCCQVTVACERTVGKHLGRGSGGRMADLKNMLFHLWFTPGK